MKMMSSMFSDMNMNNMPSAKTIVSTAASVAASAMVLRSIARDLIPYEFQQYVYSNIHSFFKSFSSDIVLIVEELDGLATNQIYKAADVYLASRMASSANRLMVKLPEKETKISTSMARNQDVIDTFRGGRFRWRQITTQVESRGSSYNRGGQFSSQAETRYFEITFHKKHKQMVFDFYFPFVLEESNRIREEKKTLKIHTLNNENLRMYPGGDNVWNSVRLEHPATFDTLAMDSDVKKMVIDDLEMFVKRREYYKKVGKAWKRGYLLYGPPGTGKSSLIAAMANYLNFDVYDLELTDIRANSDLRRLLINTANRSILVVEDIDCSLELDDRKADERALKLLRSSQIGHAQTVNIVRQQKPEQVTLSGFLNFIDGLWSSCGDERIIIFTTNHKDRLDPALLRPGRMDLHIHMSYCTPCAFRTLATNYLGITEHSLFPEIDNLLKTTKVTPAEVGERLLRNEKVDHALIQLIEFFKEKKRDDEEKEAKKLKEEQDDVTSEEEKESDNSTNKTP